MSHYLILTVSGIFALLGILSLANEECRKRHAQHKKLLHTQLVLYDVPHQTVPLSCPLYRTSNVLGRRRRRSDICLDCYEDPYISRNHAVILYDGENFIIKPVYRPKNRCHTEIILEHRLVPPEGMILQYGDRFSISGHIMMLENTNEEEGCIF